MKKKLEHIWYYYKWYILAAALVTPRNRTKRSGIFFSYA